MSKRWEIFRFAQNDNTLGVVVGDVICLTRTNDASSQIRAGQAGFPLEARGNDTVLGIAGSDHCTSQL